MDETPAYFTAVSLHLSRVLDEIGLNSLTVKRRRNTYLFTERVNDIHFRLQYKHPVSQFHFGSQTEGSTTLGLDSDVDTLICREDINVIQSLAQWQPNNMNFLILQEDTAPGYCRLQLLTPDVQIGREDLPNDTFTHDSRGRMILPNAFLFEPIQYVSNVRNRPARSGGGGICVDTDKVAALRCRSWPEQAAYFIGRRRRYGWPSPQLVQQAIKHGVFLVAVGHKLSQTEHLEWRISASMTERCLMFSLGMVHIKCYVVLKMLIKTFVQPYVGKCITSYHCKTALLHCTENTESGFWRDDNLLQCVTRCLETLIIWVNDGFCPQFMITEENLFAGKLTAKIRDELKSILTDLIKSKGRALLCVEIDDMNRLLQGKLTNEPSMVPVHDSMQTMRLVGEFECRRHDKIDEFICVFLKNNSKAAPLPVMRVACEKIKTLKAGVGCSNKHERQAIQAYIVFLSGWLGSMMASFMLSHKRPLPRKAIQLLRGATRCDIASVLKLSSVLYSNGDLHKAEKTLQRVEAHFHRNDMQAVCQCYDKLKRVTPSFCRMMYTLKGTKVRDAYFAHCVRFSAQEIHCAPPALRNELYRASGDDVQRRDPIQDKWMCLAVVDCLPFLYYLQYFIYAQLGKQQQRRRSLRNLYTCVRKYMLFLSHIETAWNLLGQCMEMEDDHAAALQCYMTSLKARPRNNAAKWHVATLCYTQLKKRGLLK